MSSAPLLAFPALLFPRGSQYHKYRNRLLVQGITDSFGFQKILEGSNRSLLLFKENIAFMEKLSISLFKNVSNGLLSLWEFQIVIVNVKFLSKVPLITTSFPALFDFPYVLQF